VIAAAHPLAPSARSIGVRDLTWLIASLMLVAAPHALRAPWWLTALTLCLFAWRFWYALNRAALPSRWLVIGVAAVAMLGVWMEYRTLFGRGPGIVLLVLFAGLKMLETRTHRDAALAAFLGYFLVITNFLYTQSIPTAVLMCVALFALTVTLVGFSAPHRAVKANARTAGLLLAHALLRNTSIENVVSRMPRSLLAGILTVMISGIILTQGNGNAFIYFQF